MPTDTDLRLSIQELTPAIARDSREAATTRIGGIEHRSIAPAAKGRVSRTVARRLRAIRHAAEETLRNRAVREQFAGGLDLVGISPLAACCGGSSCT
jgi:hypothetical protein